MMRAISALYLSLNLLISQNSVAAKRCVNIFPPAKLTAGIQKQIDLTIADLAKMRTSLDLKKVQGGNTIEFTALSADYISKEKQLLAYLEKNNFMTEQELFEKIKIQVQQATISQKNKETKEDKRRRRIETDHLRMQQSDVNGSIMIFNRVNPGSFKMGPEGNKVDVTISKPFEMLAIPTTQVMWKKVLWLVKPMETLDHYLKSDPSDFEGDTHPVVKVSYIDVVYWIKHLNRLSKAGEPGLKEIFPGFQKGDKFRLPTAAEWEFVARNRGQYNDRLPPGMQLEDHAWVKTNSSPPQTQPVAQKLPLIVDHRPYYDLYGNVWEHVALNTGDLAKEDGNLTNQYAFTPHPSRGGSWNSSPREISAATADISSTHSKTTNTGFRLVREVRR